MKLLKNKYFILGNLFLILLAIPLTLFLVNRQQQTRSQAEASTVISLLPSSTTVNVGDDVALEVQVNPGTNVVGVVHVKITYDPSKLEYVGIKPEQFTINGQSTTFSMSRQPTVASSSGLANIDALMDGGSNQTGHIRDTAAEIATLTFKALAPTTPTTPVDFSRGKGLTEAFSSLGEDAPNGDNPNTDIIQSANGAVITILAGGPPEITITDSPTPTPPGTSNSKALCTNLSSTDTTGTAPLSVTLTANGNDTDGTITKATFNFGDGQTDDITDNMDTQSVVTQVDHTFESAGTYNVSVNFSDDQGLVGDPCSLTISVVNEGDSISSTPIDTTTVTLDTSDTSTVETATPTQIENTASPTLAPTGGVIQTIGILGGIILSIIGGIFLLTL